jgi:type III secretory pathway lipoprotein EscJ
MVQVAVAGDTTEADEIQKLLLEAGIDSKVEAEEEADALAILVPEDQVEAAQDAVELMTEPDDIIADA